MPKYREEIKKLLEADNFLMDDMAEQLEKIGILKEMLRRQDIQTIIDRVLRLTGKIICEHNRKNVQVIRGELSGMTAESEYVPSTAQSIQEQARTIFRFFLQGILQMQKELQKNPISAPKEPISTPVKATDDAAKGKKDAPAPPQLQVIPGGKD